MLVFHCPERKKAYLKYNRSKLQNRKAGINCTERCLYFSVNTLGCIGKTKLLTIIITKASATIHLTDVDIDIKQQEVLHFSWQDESRNHVEQIAVWERIHHMCESYLPVFSEFRNCF